MFVTFLVSISIIWVRVSWFDDKCSDLDKLAAADLDTDF